MDTELLKTFMEVRSTRHFGRAAQNLFITQAAVSARIKQLESLLGVTLFIRHRNNIQLSPEGERLVPHAETVLSALARARQEVALEESASAQVYMGVRMGIWSDALQQRLYRLNELEPELALSLENHEPSELVRRLVERTLDLAILYEPPSLPELSCRPIGELSLRLYSSARKGGAEAAVANNYVHLDWGGGFSRFHGRHFGEHAPAVLRSNIPEVAIGFLAARGGSCYLPYTLRERLAALDLKPVRGAPQFVRTLNIAHHSGVRNPSLVESVVKSFTGVKV